MKPDSLGESKASKEIFRFDDFELDRGTYELRHAGQRVRLQRLPFELLYLLVERHGQLVTREEIIERIWGKGVFVDSENSINTAMNKIRRALNDDADAPRFVVTVPARGYRFIAPIREECSAIPVPEASPVSAVAEASPTADAADAGSTMITKADMLLQKGQRRGILWSIGGIAFVIAAIVLIEQLSLRPPTTIASIPPQQKLALPFPNIPSIAVLPFTNMSGDRDQEYFSDGITNDLITSLSRSPGLFVIDRASTFTYKGKPVKVPEVSRELGVKYVLEGGVEKAAEQVRITAQLVDATTGTELWAERYDRPMNDIFALQDEIVRRIVTTMGLRLRLWEQYGVLIHKRTENLEAYHDLLRGVEYESSSYTKEDNARAQQMFEKAIELDPKYADAYALLGYSCWWDFFWQWSQDPKALERAFDLEQRAILLDDSLSRAFTVLGRIYALRGQYKQALADGERAIALDPNSATAYYFQAETLTFAGRPAEAIESADKAARLNPRNRDDYLVEAGFAYTFMGRFAEAVPILKRRVSRYPNALNAHLFLAINFIELGREEKARVESVEVTRISPHFSLEAWQQRNPIKDQALQDRCLADLRKAGLK